MSKDSNMIFEKGEKVLCYHGPLIYEAKCLEAEMQDNQAKYYIHYAGWNKNWDEWVPENRVLKYNDTNIQKQKDLQRTLKSNPQRNKKIIKPKRTDGKDGDTTSTDRTSLSSSVLQDTPVTSPAQPDVVGRKKRGRYDNTDMTESGGKTEVVTSLPDALKAWLVQEYNYIHKQDKLVVLPARKTVLNIATEYFESKVANTEDDPFVEQVVGEVLDGLMDHFAVSLPAELLYPREKTQYKQMCEKYPDTPLCEIYGGSHLLRMLAKFGSKLGSPRFDDFTTDLILQYINELMRFIADDLDSFLGPDDYTAT